MVEAVVLKGHVLRVHLYQFDMIEPVEVLLLLSFVEHFSREINTDDMTTQGIERKRDTGADAYLDHPVTFANTGSFHAYLDSWEKNMRKRLVVEGRTSTINFLHFLLIHGLEVSDKARGSQGEMG